MVRFGFTGDQTAIRRDGNKERSSQLVVRIKEDDDMISLLTPIFDEPLEVYPLFCSCTEFLRF